MNSKRHSTPLVVITNMSPRWSYFQYFILSFYELEKQNKIRLKFRCDLWSYLSTKINEKYIYTLRLLRKACNTLCKDSYLLEGYIKYDGIKRSFCIDSADSPFMYNSTCLDKVDVYFKMQCPKELNPEGFRLTDEVVIPYCDHKHKTKTIKGLTNRGERCILHNFEQNIHKIKPLMVGFRELSISNSYKSLKHAFLHYINAAHNSPQKKLMCYFGNSLGPVSSIDVKIPDYDNESDLMGYYKKKLNHPNEKRAIVAKYIKSMGDKFDARIIVESNSDRRSEKRNEHLIVPLNDFCSYISQFEYNMNVSGYRLSIPNRFIESFIVGTSILTDKLSVKWYMPFDEEVIETVEMGYKHNNLVNWEKFRKDLHSLPKVSKRSILKCFNQKWAPIKVGEYIIKTLIPEMNLDKSI